MLRAISQRQLAADRSLDSFCYCPRRAPTLDMLSRLAHATGSTLRLAAPGVSDIQPGGPPDQGDGLDGRHEALAAARPAAPGEPQAPIVRPALAQAASSDLGLPQVLLDSVTSHLKRLPQQDQKIT